MQTRDLTPIEVFQREVRHLKRRLDLLDPGEAADQPLRYLLEDLLSALQDYADATCEGAEAPRE